MAKAAGKKRAVRPQVKARKPKNHYMNAASSCGLGRVLRFGCKSSPKTVVVVFHGCGDNAPACAKDWADVWAAGLDKALVVVPESSSTTPQDEGKGDDAGRDWLRHLVADFRDQEACVRVLQRTTRNRLRLVNKWLDMLLKSHNLTNANLILTGFSQGCVLAALAGAHRRVRGVALVGGIGTEPIRSRESAKADKVIGREVWARWEELMPRSAPGTQFWALQGTKDTTVPRRKIERLLAPFDCTWRYEKGLEHWQLFYKRYRNTMLKWMREVQSSDVR
eukprot:TRINITY_DN12052_c0_g1_i1.p1 TRINITY_DN12052_c0_g1~~TRINITY_DN12052_c0_g1_i1.p1  ORF type:complete len:299 (+),score=55.44 TRINITY_DN12052_c0_g1_i1:65-898(+)